MAKFKGAVLSCVECGAEFRVPPTRAKTAVTCSRKCAGVYRGKRREQRVTLTCRFCEKPFQVPRSHAERRVYCSHHCLESAPETVARKAGWTGENNSHWKGGRHLRRDGYYYGWAPGHPFASNNYVLEHRLVLESWLREHEPASPFLIEVDGQLYLSRSYEVHHKDENKRNNDIANLQAMTPAAHRAHHNREIKKALAFYRKHHPQPERVSP